MSHDATDFPAASPLSHPMTTASLVIAVLESRRSYQRALSLAKRLLLAGSPSAMIWGDDADRQDAIEQPNPTVFPLRSTPRRGYPAFRMVGAARPRQRHGLRVMPSENTL
jgi:hypothetical protein